MKGFRFWIRLFSVLTLLPVPIFTVVACNKSNSSGSSTIDISTGVTVNNLKITAANYQNYSMLNQNNTIITAVTNAILTGKNVAVTLGTDFTLSNDQVGNQIPGATVTFTVTAIGNKILGKFNFSIILEKPDITNIVNVVDLHTPADPSKTFDALNNNSNIINAVTNAINAAAYTTVKINQDFTLSNNQTGVQAAGTIVTFTVAAVLTSQLITGSFTFVNTLGKVDISSGVTVNNLRTPIDPNGTYGDLNRSRTIINAVANAIYVAKSVSVTVNVDFTLTNNQFPGDVQAADTLVTFTATAIGSQITGSFTFINTLQRVNISSGVTVNDLKTPADPSNIYNSLNTNSVINNAIVRAIYNAKGITVTPNSDYTLTNDQPQNNKQAVAQVVTFTVTAIGSQIVGSFSFIDTLGQVNISNGVSVPDLKTSTNNSDIYDSLNTNSVITNVVSSAIFSAKGIAVTVGTDFTLSNNQTGYQNPGTVVIFTVTATLTSTLITGSFSFIDTLAKISVASGVSVPDLKTAVDPNGTYGDLNTNPNIINAIVEAILAAKNVNVELGVDFSLKNNKVTTATQVAGVVTFTVAAVSSSSQISGAFTFVDTLTKTT